MLNVAIKAARAAGAIINRAALDVDLLKISVKGPNDFVSEVDRAAPKRKERNDGKPEDDRRVAALIAPEIQKPPHRNAPFWTIQV